MGNAGKLFTELAVLKERYPTLAAMTEILTHMYTLSIIYILGCCLLVLYFSRYTTKMLLMAPL